MIERIKILTLMQLKNRKNKRLKSKSNTAISIIVQVAVCALVTVGLYYLINYIRQLSLIPIDTNFFLFMLFITQAISILTCIFGLTNFLYMSKDNSVIFSMPAKPAEIFISKLAVFYITEFKKNLFFLLPFFLAFGFVLKLDYVFYIFVVFLIFLLPLLPVFIGAIFSFPLMYLKKLLKKVPILKVLLALVIAGLVIWLLVYITNIIPRPLNLLVIYDKFFVFLKNVILSVNKFSLIYEVIANMMLGVNVGINILILLATLIVLAGLTLLIGFLYFKIASQNFEHSIKVKKREVKPSKNIFMTFLKKEFILNMRNTETFISHILYIISLPVLLYVVNEIISAININLNGVAIAVAVNIFIGLMFLTSTNTISASAITGEGAEFGLIKTAPSDTSKICYAKFTVNFVISFVGIVASMIVLAVTSSFSSLSLLAMFFTFVFVNTAHMFWSLQIDLLHPRLTEYASSGNMRDNKNIGTCILIGVLISIVVAMLAYFCFKGVNIINILKLPLIAGLFFALRLYLFQVNLKVYFNKIQM